MNIKDRIIEFLNEHLFRPECSVSHCDRGADGVDQAGAPYCIWHNPDAHNYTYSQRVEKETHSRKRG